MSRRVTVGAGAAFALGLGLTAFLVWRVGPQRLAAAAAAVGWGGYGLYLAASLVVFAPLGLAWWTLAPRAPLAKAPAFVWARVLREAASDFLPLAQVTGLLVGLRVVAQSGVGEAEAVGSQVADLAAEMAAQLLYTLFGVVMLASAIAHAPRADLLVAAVLALVFGAAGLVGLLVFQGRSIDLVARIAGRWLKDTAARAEAVHAVLAEIYRSPARLLAGFALHGLGWVLSGLVAWLALRLMGVEVAVWRVLTLDSLMAAVRSVAFMSPGALGVQETAYVLAAPLLGIPPGPALALSLLRRAKDMTIGAPALLAWQAEEGRHMWRRRRAARGS